jgi:hypothetical protein
MVLPFLRYTSKMMCCGARPERAQINLSDSSMVLPFLRYTSKMMCCGGICWKAPKWWQLKCDIFSQLLQNGAGDSDVVWAPPINFSFLFSGMKASIAWIPSNIPISSTAGVCHHGWFYWFLLGSRKCAVLQSLEYILAKLVDYKICVSFWIAH